MSEEKVMQRLNLFGSKEKNEATEKPDEKKNKFNALRLEVIIPGDVRSFDAYAHFSLLYTIADKIRAHIVSRVPGLDTSIEVCPPARLEDNPGSPSELMEINFTFSKNIGVFNKSDLDSILTQQEKNAIHSFELFKLRQTYKIAKSESLIR